ncbi:hypothetical protein KAFR_0B06230 [Kazachstania africana CBS 2517]|uniref:DASH complex subunit SPC19 n=1 Tax=Kazachstania africana (strain ATCC 22294 / BCRC 22015 / CBS 2517 / CECT 1963 / NBRC 1671 / NRRL Y-8276) TaxID=1071382 RepID=H2ARC0_KAZAF|nr:hypothetical protein KAFR_0B06230 [Kazachstania africana CBS 2517]CCF56920.1 hypothetical protein KAFR_0B06230 [Kazachstania africana CBS 2517]
MAEALESSVVSLESTISLLQDSIETLKTDSKDNNYLTDTMLRCNQVFELIPEFDIERARNDLNEEVEPLIRTLQEKLKKSLSKMTRELDTLKQTFELNQLRLNNTATNNETDLSSDDINVSTDDVVMASSTNEELEELKRLRLKREELQERLNQLNQ